jgi:hypothetical protein
LFGAITAEINGIRTAIMVYGDTPREKDEFFAELFHEMHHVYQINEQKKLKFPNVALLVTYPEIAENAALVQMENRTLLRLIFAESDSDFKENIDLFYSLRSRRKEIIGDAYMDYEESEESLEGPAVYCEYKFREDMNKSNEFDNLSRISQYGRFFLPLMERRCTKNNLRELKLMTGLCQCLIIDKREPDWKKEYYRSGISLTEFFFKKFPAQRVEVSIDSNDLLLSNYFINLERQKKREKFDDFKKQEGIYVEAHFLSIPGVGSIDPMHMEAIDDTTILHNTLIKLGKGENFLYFPNGGVCCIIDKNLWINKSLFFFIKNKNQLRVENGYINLNCADKKMKWAGRIIKESNKQIIIELK